MAETYVLQTLERLRGHQLTYVDARRVWCLFGATVSANCGDPIGI